jgi:cytochrome c-type protein NapC
MISLKEHVMTVMRLVPAAFLASFAAAAAAPNWTQVPAKTITLFTPGQTSLEWIMTPGDHKGADRFRTGKDCISCHIGQERALGAVTASGKKYELTPIKGKPGTLDAKLQFAHDAQNLYVRVEFSDAGQPDAKMDKAAAKVAMMLDGGGTPEAARAGCWAMCHDDSTAMPSARGASRTMYLGKTRAQMTRQGGGDGLKPAGELSKLKAGGYGLEYWEASLGTAPVATNGVIFDKRQETRPVVTAEASHKGAIWTVVLSRKLSAGTVTVTPGKKYAVAFAIDAGHTAKRFHYVSFERSLVLDQGSADFIARK